MDQHVVLTCPVTVFSRSALPGNLTPIGNHSRLTVNYFNGDGHPPSIIVYDERRRERLKILVATEVAKYKIIDRFNHEIIRYEDTTIILVFYHNDTNIVRAFTDLMENVFKDLNRFTCTGQARDSSSSGSDDDDPYNGAAAAAAPAPVPVRTVRPATPTVTFWDCANCEYGSTDEHGWRCQECSRSRVIDWHLEWQCDCLRVYDNGISECSQCGIWKCHKCTFQNISTSLQCYLCHTLKSSSSIIYDRRR